MFRKKLINVLTGPTGTGVVTAAVGGFVLAVGGQLLEFTSEHHGNSGTTSLDLQMDAETSDGDRRHHAASVAALIRAAVESEIALASSLDLQGIDLTGVQLQRINLSRARMSNANLRYTNLTSANLNSTKLYAADLYGSNLRGASLRYSDLRYANLDNADFTDADLTGARLQGASFRGARLDRAILERVWLSGAKLDAKTLQDAQVCTSVPEAANVGLSSCTQE